MYELIKILPIQFDGWDHIDDLVFAYYDAEFTADFGEFKIGEKFPVLDVNYEEGIIEGYDEEGDLIIKSQKFTCIPA